MRPVVLLLAALAVAADASAAAAQVWHGGFVQAGRGGAGTELYAPRFALEGGYTAEVGDRVGPWVGGRYTFGIHWLRADADGFARRYGGGAVDGGDADVLDTGVDVEVGYGFGAVRAYGFAGIHYLRQSQEAATIAAPGGDVEVRDRRSVSLAEGYGAGVQLYLVDRSGITAEWYRTGGDDGVMRLDGLRFGLRWAW